MPRKTKKTEARKGVIYARFSSHAQREESIMDQIRVCSDYAEREGIEIAATYADEARSGTNAAGRPEFLRMVSDAQKSDWDCVIVYKSDRFARNRYDAATYKAKLRKAGVELLSATEGVPDGPEGIILESVLEGMAEYYSANLAQNVKRGMEGNALKCLHNGVQVFGYDCMPDGTYEVNEHEAQGVRAVFSMVASGSTKAAAARHLNHGGWRTKRGREFGVEAVSSMLDNERYIGVYSWGEVRVEGGMPAIIERRQWDDVHAKIKARGTRKGVRNESYLLSGKMYDADGNPFESNCGTSRNGKRHYYYRVKSTGASMRKDDAEDRVRRAVAQVLDENPELDEMIVDVVMQAQSESESVERDAIDAMKKRLPQIDREIDNLIELAAKTGAGRTIPEKLRALEREREVLALQIEDMESRAPLIEPDMVRYLLFQLRQCSGPDSIVRGFVDRIEVDENGGMLVIFNLCTHSDLREQEKSQTDEDRFGKLRFGRHALELGEHAIYPTPWGFAIAA